MGALVKHWHTVLLWLFLSVSFVIYGLHLLGITKLSGLLHAAGPEGIIVMLSLLGLYLISENVRLGRSLDALQSKIGQEAAGIRAEIHRSGSALSVRSFDTHEEFLEYVTAKIRAAHTSVEDLSWAHNDKPTAWNEHRATLEAGYDEAVIQASKRIRYREVFVFERSSRVRQMEKRLSFSGKGYECGCFSQSKPPRLQFMVIDRSEVVFMRSGESHAFSVTGKPLVEYLCLYYDDIWRRSEKIKEAASERPLDFSRFVPKVLRNNIHSTDVA